MRDSGTVLDNCLWMVFLDKLFTEYGRLATAVDLRVAVTTTSSIRFTESTVVWELADKNEKDNPTNKRSLRLHIVFIIYRLVLFLVMTFPLFRLIIHGWPLQYFFPIQITLVFFHGLGWVEYPFVWHYQGIGCKIRLVCKKI